MIKAVIFDLDNTLCDTYEAITPALRNTFSYYLSHFPEKTVDEMLEINELAFKETFLNPSISIPSAQILIWYKIFELLSIKPPVKAIVEMVEYIQGEVRNKIKLFNGAEELLTFLRNEDIKIGILTNGSFIEQSRKITSLGIESYVDYLVTPEMTFVNKPHERAFLYILEKLNTKPWESVMIGDSLYSDIDGAKKVGMQTVFMKKYDENEIRGIRKTPDYSSYNFFQIIEFLKELIKR